MRRMSRGAWIRFVLVLGLLVGCAVLALNKEPRLGLDLSGGTSITLETKDSPSGVEANAENTDRAVEVLRGRVDALGVSEPTLVRSGDNRILVELPDVQDSEQAVNTIGRTAQLTVHPVVQGGLTSADGKPSKKGNLLVPSEQGDVLEVGPQVMEGNDITGAEAVQPQNSTGWAVAVDFSGTGSRRLREALRRCRLRAPATSAGSRSCSTARSSPRPQRPGRLRQLHHRQPPRSPETSRSPRPASSPS